MLSPKVIMLVLVEVPLYSFNKEIVAIGAFKTLDMGGTIFIHLFGAYFGLAAAYVIGGPSEAEADDAKASTVSDALAFVGTVFLWIYWPSFNGATALGAGNQQLLTTANTVFSLCGSTLSAFLVSVAINGKIMPVDIQNATLAGGVAIGAASNLRLGAAPSLIVGILAGSLSTYGFNRVQPWLEQQFGLHDSCGVHNLHGMPAVLGSVVVMIATGVSDCRGEVVYPTANQPLAQFEGFICTLLIALAGGSGFGWLVRATGGKTQRAFTDAPYWGVAEHKHE
jgi:ammonium transporter Rh